MFDFFFYLTGIETGNESIIGIAKIQTTSNPIHNIQQTLQPAKHIYFLTSEQHVQAVTSNILLVSGS